MILRIVVADEHEASFFDVVGPRAPLTLASKIENPTARLHDRDLRVRPTGQVVQQRFLSPAAMIVLSPPGGQVVPIVTNGAIAPT
jgi:hypothetical protein